MASNQIFVVGKQFSAEPSGRYYADGEASGEALREQWLKPLLTSQETLALDLVSHLDVGYGASFLMEAFGGLVKYGHFTATELLHKLRFVGAEDDADFYQKKVVQYINEAAYNSAKYTPSAR